MTEATLTLPRAKASPKKQSPKKYLLTAVGILILCVMLFPVYWMINISLHPGGDVAYSIKLRDRGTPAA